MVDKIVPIAKLIDEFSKLPGIGKKTASKLAFWTIERKESDVIRFAKAMVEAKQKIGFCKLCGHFTEREECNICSDPKRDRRLLMVVEEARDIFVIENTNEYQGLYHVLHGAISPLEGVSPDDLNIKSLLPRLEQVEELILATNTTIEGEATAIYISKLLSCFDIKVTRIAKGIPIGGDIEYADEITLAKALEGRREL